MMKFGISAWIGMSRHPSHCFIDGPLTAENYKRLVGEAAAGPGHKFLPINRVGVNVATARRYPK